MKIKHTLMIVVIGKLLILGGAMSKLNHTPSSSYLLTIGLALILVGGLAFLYKLSTHPKVKEFLNF